MSAQSPISVVSRAPVRLGIPPLFLADPLERGYSAAQVLSRHGSVLAEYADARGYVFDWGHLVVDDTPPFRLWRIVPTALWERLAQDRRDSRLRIPDLVPLLAPIVLASVKPCLPQGLELTGLQQEGRRSPHALFGLVLTDSEASRRVLRWIEKRLLAELLPRVLQESDVALRNLLEPVDLEAENDRARN